MENKCNAKKTLRWWTVFRHKFVHMVCLRERDPNSIAYCIKKRNISDSYIPRRVWDCDHRFCYCGLSCRSFLPLWRSIWAKCHSISTYITLNLMTKLFLYINEWSKKRLVVYFNIQHCPSLYTKKQLEKFMSSQVCPHMIKINETN